MIHLFHTQSLKSFALLILAVLLSSCSSVSHDHGPQAESSTGPRDVLSSIAVKPGNSSIGMQQTMQFTAVGIYGNGSSENLTGSVIWSTSDESIVSIGETGLATA